MKKIKETIKGPIIRFNPDGSIYIPSNKRSSKKKNIPLKKPKKIIYEKVKTKSQRTKKQIDPQIISRILSEYREGDPLRVLMKRYKLSQGTLVKLLKQRLGPEYRERRDYKSGNWNERFKKLWFDKSINRKQIAKKLGISVSQVWRESKRLNLPPRYGGDHPEDIELNKMIKRLYLGAPQVGIKRHSMLEISKITGLNDETIRRRLLKKGIKPRTASGQTKEEIREQDKVIKELFDKGYYVSEIGNVVGLGKHGMEKRIKKLGLNTRKRKIHPQKKKYYDQIVDYLFSNSRNNIASATRRFKISDMTIKTILERKGLYERYKLRPRVQNINRGNQNG